MSRVTTVPTASGFATVASVKGDAPLSCTVVYRRTRDDDRGRLTRPIVGMDDGNEDGDDAEPTGCEEAPEGDDSGSVDDDDDEEDEGGKVGKGEGADANEAERDGELAGEEGDSGGVSNEKWDDDAGE